MMTMLSKNKHTQYVWMAWLVLMTLTAASWWMGADHGVENMGKSVTMVSILVLTFAKIFVVGHSFMELREAASWLVRAFAGWCIGLCTVLCVLYLQL